MIVLEERTSKSVYGEMGRLPLWRRLLPTLLWGVATVLFLASVPVFLISTNARWAINEPRLYNWGFSWFDIPKRTGISQQQLERGGQQIRDYFNNGEEFLDFRVVLDGSEVSLYKEREILHMRDVKRLIQGVYTLQLASLAYLLAFTVAALFIQRREGLAWLSRLVTWGAFLTVAFTAGVGLASAVAWRQVFLLFHLVSFDNLLWILDPRTDYLVQMFPAGFFLTATLLIAGVTLAECAALALLPRWMRRKWAAAP